MQFILIILLIVFLIFLVPKMSFRLDTINLVTGSVKSGKSCLSVQLMLKEYNRRMLLYKLTRFLPNRFRKNKPHLYSNIKLNIKHPYNLVTDKELLTRDLRLHYGSILLIDECSLLANSMQYKDRYINDNLNYFFKLFGHSTKGGCLIYNTQALNDVHYSMERVISHFTYIDRMVKVPFFLIFYYYDIKCLNSNISNNLINNVEELQRKCFICSKKVFKKYDRYTYSCLTDNLAPFENIQIHNSKDLKTDNILTLNDTTNLMKGVKKNDKKNS